MRKVDWSGVIIAILGTTGFASAYYAGKCVGKTELLTKKTN